MSNEKTPTDKYIEACRGCSDLNNTSELKEQIVDNMLKREMKNFADEQDVDINSNWTKERIAEELINPDIFENLLGREEQTSEKPIELEPFPQRPERPEPEISFTESIEKISESFESYSGPMKIWNTILERMEDNINSFTQKNLDYIEQLEDNWTENARDFQDMIDNLQATDIPYEDQKEFSVIWRNFYNKMSARFIKISNEMRERQESISESIDEYNEEINEILSGEKFDIVRMYRVWNELSEDIRKDIEKTNGILDFGQEELNETWDEFSKKTREILEEMNEKQNEQIQEIYNIWNSSFSDWNDNINQGFQQYQEIYDDLLTNLNKQGENISEIMVKTAKEFSKNYNNMLDDYVKLLQSNYMVWNPVTNISDLDKDLKDLEKRISKLENDFRA